MPEAFEVHECHGPSIYAYTTPETHTIYNQCVICKVEWPAMIINLNTVRRLKMTNDPQRHPAVTEILKYFKFEHLPPHLQAISKPCCELAYLMADECNGPEVTVGLRKLLEAKDCFVRSLVE